MKRNLSSSEPEDQDSETPQVYAIRFTARAQADIDGEWDRLQQIAGQDVADDWKSGLFALAGTLATLPQRQVLAPENRRFQKLHPDTPAIRQIVFRRRASSPAYRVLFTLIDATDDAPFVRILHVRHGARRPLKGKEIDSLEENPPPTV